MVDKSTSDFIQNSTEWVFALSPFCYNSSIPGLNKQILQIQLAYGYYESLINGIYFIGDDHCGKNLPLYTIKETIHMALQSVQGFFWEKKYLFTKFNYGFLGNLLNYQSLSAPIWDMSLFPKQVKQTIFHNELEFSNKEALDFLINEIGRESQKYSNNLSENKINEKLIRNENIEFKVMKGWKHLDNTEDKDHTQLFNVLEKDLLN